MSRRLSEAAAALLFPPVLVLAVEPRGLALFAHWLVPWLATWVALVGIIGLVLGLPVPGAWRPAARVGVVAAASLGAALITAWIFQA